MRCRSGARKAANPRSLAALIAWMQSCGRRQPVKGLDRLSGDWRAIKRAPIALDRLPPPARLHPSDQGARQGCAPLRLLHPLRIQKRRLFRPPFLVRKNNSPRARALKGPSESYSIRCFLAPLLRAGPHTSIFFFQRPPINVEPKYPLSFVWFSRHTVRRSPAATKRLTRYQHPIALTPTPHDLRMDRSASS